MKFRNHYLAPIFLLLSALFSAPAAAQITWIKAFTPNSSKTTGTSIAVTVPAGGIATGNSVIVSLAMDPVTGTVSCTDTVSNSYAIDRDVINGSSGSGVRTVIFSAHNVSALASGNTITCTHPSVAARALSATEFSGLAVSGAKDQTTSATGQSTAPSSGNTGTTTQAAELLIGAIGVEGPSGDTFTPGSNYSTTGRGGSTGGNAATNITINPEYHIVNATGAYAASATLGTSRKWGAAIVTYKAAPPVATKLAFSTQPGNSAAGSALTGPPTVVVQDSLGNTVTSSTASVTVAIGTNPSGGTLSGTSTKNASGGVAAFTDLSINQAGNGYTLTATSAGLTSATSSTFNVSATTGTVGGTVVRASDSQPISGALVEALQVGVLKGSAATAANGSYSISNLAVGSYDVRASSAGYGTQSQNGQSVTAGATTTVNFSLVSAPNITGVSPTSGVIGTVVTINGTGFGATLGSSTISFNGTSATPSSWGNTSIVAPVPSGATTGPVVVTVAGVASNGSAFTVLGSGSVIYVYDELGRLRAVTEPSSDTAVYNYDAVGNLLSISRQSSSLVSVIEFSPNSGPAGTNVTIYGTGFSATAGQNTVTFNGTTAAVISSTPTQIVATVPAGATTGPIGVTTSGGSAASAKVFTIANSAAPTITGFTPSIGTIGTSVTITGTNFATTPSANSLRFNLTPVNVSAATSTSLSTAVPTLTGSGRISVSTQYGRATSSADFFIPPSPYTAADIEYTGRMTMGGPSHTVTIATANKNGLVVFDRGQNQRVSLQMTNVGIPNSYIYIAKPDQTNLVGPVYTGTGGAYIDMVTLPVAGTYTILVDPLNFDTGSMTLTLYDIPSDFTTTITPGGAPVTVTTTVPGQNAKATFSGTANQRVSLQMTNVTIPNSYIHIVKPDGTNLVGAVYTGTGGTYIDTVTLPATGTYTIFVDPINLDTGSMTLTLYDIPSDYTTTITPGGAPVTVTTTVPGQNAKATFDGTANQKISLQMTSVTFGWATVSILKPDQTALVTTGTGTGGNFIDSVTLPTAGTYTIFVDPQSTLTGSMALTLYDIPSDYTTTITPGGAPVTVTTTVPGQNAKATFDGTANQKISLQMTSVTFGWATVSILKPDQTALVTTGTGTGGNFIDSVTLPTAGTYTIFVDPQSTLTGSMTLTLYDIPSDFTTTITPGGAPVTVTTTVPGQNGRVTFDGAANQKISLQMTSVTFGWATVSILKPDQTALVTTGTGTGGNFIDSVTLPTAGTYTIFVDPQSTLTGSMTLTLYDVVDVTGSVFVNGSSVPVSITTLGQRAILTFAGTASQQVTVRITDNTIPWVTVDLNKPDGSQLTTSSSGSPSFNLSTQTLPSTDTYSIVVDPQWMNLGNLSVSVTNP